MVSSDAQGLIDSKNQLTTSLSLMGTITKTCGYARLGQCSEETACESKETASPQSCRFVKHQFHRLSSQKARVLHDIGCPPVRYVRQSTLTKQDENYVPRSWKS
ncbi:hypothetical protein RB195_015606 [Necator americanus]|uniref:Phlebovirus glycoprotein G2 fusion domain-containing protein n=1 Tax=Necator americanus TaxID=51031 RepID=A0ABR1E5C1_NECAM